MSPFTPVDLPKKASYDYDDVTVDQTRVWLGVLSVEDFTELYDRDAAAEAGFVPVDPKDKDHSFAPVATGKGITVDSARDNENKARNLALKMRNAMVAADPTLEGRVKSHTVPDGNGKFLPAVSLKRKATA